MESMQQPMRPEDPAEAGGVMLTMLLLLMPLVLIMATFTMTMTSRTNRLMGEVDDERALMAAEAGLLRVRHPRPLHRTLSR